MKPKIDEKFKARFWSKVSVLKIRQCWEWQSCISPNGYGKISINCYPHSAHRISYEIFFPDFNRDLWIDHKCKNRKCVNPNHLRAVTPKINAIENSDSPSAKNALKTHCIRGHEFSETNTSIVNRPGKKHRACKICSNNRKKKARETLAEIAELEQKDKGEK